MQLDTSYLVRSLDGVPADKLDRFAQVPAELAGAADEVLGDSDGVTVTRLTGSGRNLMTWKKNERNRKKRQRRAKRLSKKKNR